MHCLEHHEHGTNARDGDWHQAGLSGAAVPHSCARILAGATRTLSPYGRMIREEGDFNFVTRACARWRAILAPALHLQGMVILGHPARANLYLG